MSSLVVEVCRIDKVETHPNSDRMCIVTIKGWKCCTTHPYKVGEKCMYFPPDCIIPKVHADKWEVTKYLAQLAQNSDGTRPDGGRVQVARLRGQPSYGFVIPIEDESWEVGKDLIPVFGITKWEPSVSCLDGDSEKPHPAFHKYFDLENWQNFPEFFVDGEEVVISEKIHGKNCRFGFIKEVHDDGSAIWRFAAGSHDVRRKEMQVLRKRRPMRNEDGTAIMEKVERNGEEVEQEAMFAYEVTQRSQFWDAMSPKMKDMMMHLSRGQNNIVVFAELYGSGVQDMAYGLENGNYEVRVFDITVNGKYMDVDDKFKACSDYGIATVPILYRGPFSKEIVESYVSGPTTLCAPEKAGKFKGREGVVITSVKERTVQTEKKFFDRAALKAVSFEYKERKGGSEFH